MIIVILYLLVIVILARLCLRNTPLTPAMTAFTSWTWPNRSSGSFSACSERLVKKLLPRHFRIARFPSSTRPVERVTSLAFMWLLSELKAFSQRSVLRHRVVVAIIEMLGMCMLQDCYHRLICSFDSGDFSIKPFAPSALFPSFSDPILPFYVSPERTFLATFFAAKTPASPSHRFIIKLNRHSGAAYRLGNPKMRKVRKPYALKQVEG